MAELRRCFAWFILLGTECVATICRQFKKLTQTQQEVAIMRTDPLPHEVREMVMRSFQDFGAAIFELRQVDETILFDRGRAVARSYKADGFMAMWLLRVGVVQFYDADGNMLMTVNMLEELEPQRLAA